MKSNTFNALPTHRDRTARPASLFLASPSVCTLCVAAAVAAFLPASALGGAEAEPQRNAQAGDVAMTSYGTVDLAVQDTDLAQVLQMLSIQSKKNIITSPGISATVTANLYDVTFHEALDSILRVNGYGYIEEGNFVYIYTLAELAEIERAARRTESRIFELEHLSASDAREFVEPLLSADGRISARGEVRAGFRPDIGDGGADEYAFTAKVVVNDYPDHLDQIADLLRDLDTPPQQVLVEATVLRTTLSEDSSFGIDFSVIGSMDFTDLFNPLSGVTDLLLGGAVPGDKATDTTGFQPSDNRAWAVSAPFGQTHRPGGLKFGIIHDNVSVFLRLLDEVSDTKVLARPKILALNRQRAQVLVGERVAYRSTTATQTSTTQNVEFLNTGIELAFRPFISRNGMIRMEIQPKVSFAVLREIGDGEQVPDEFTNELTTNIRVRDGETLVLGGLFQEDVTRRRRQVPLLGDVPILGAAFRGHDDEVRRSEIIFLLTPTIVRDETLWEMGKDAMGYVEAATVGARQGLLPFSRTRITTHYNQQAIESWNRGQHALAEWYINHSLRLDPHQPEMINLRQRLPGVRTERAHETSVLERVFRRELGPIRDDELPMEPHSFHDEHPWDPSITRDDPRHAIGWHSPASPHTQMSKSRQVEKSTRWGGEAGGAAHQGVEREYDGLAGDVYWLNPSSRRHGGLPRPGIPQEALDAAGQPVQTSTSTPRQPTPEGSPHANGQAAGEAPAGQVRLSPPMRKPADSPTPANSASKTTAEQGEGMNGEGPATRDANDSVATGSPLAADHFRDLFQFHFGRYPSRSVWPMPWFLSQPAPGHERGADGETTPASSIATAGDDSPGQE